MRFFKLQLTAKRLELTEIEREYPCEYQKSSVLSTADFLLVECRHNFLLLSFMWEESFLFPATTR